MAGNERTASLHEVQVSPLNAIATGSPHVSPDSSKRAAGASISIGTIVVLLGGRVSFIEKVA